MKNTKFIKILVEEMLPDKEGDYFISSSSMAYEGERAAFFNGIRFIDKYGSNMHVDYWLQEVPDYEQDMKEMLEELTTHHFNFMGCDEINELKSRAEELLTKLKTES